MTNKRIISMALALCMILSAASAIMGVSYASTTYKMGDVDNNGKIDSGDARTALRISVKLEKFTKADREFICADINGNSIVESGEARLILRASVKLEDPSKWTVPAYAKAEETTTKAPEPVETTTKAPEPVETTTQAPKPAETTTQEDKQVVRKMVQPTCEKGEKIVENKDGAQRFDQYTFTFKTIPQNLEELKQIDISNKETGGCLTTCLAMLIYDTYIPQDGEMYGATSKNKTLEEVYAMLKYLCEYNPDSNLSTTYHNKLGATDTKQFIHDRLAYNNKYKYTINSYKNGATVLNGYTPITPVSITVTDPKITSQEVKGYPTTNRFTFTSAGADGERFIDMFYSTKNNRWYVYGRSWRYLLEAVKDPYVPWILVDDPTVPAGRKMEQPTYKKTVKELKDFTYIDGETGEKKTETVYLNQYTFTFKTLPQTLGELKQFDMSDPETGGYLLTCLAILIYDIYVPQDGELTSNPSKNATLEEVYKMQQYLCNYDPDSNAATNYHNRLEPVPTKQFVHDRLAYNEKYRYTINSYKNGATPENEYTPASPVSITVTEYVYDLGEARIGYPKLQRFNFNSSGADSARFLDAFYDTVNKRWFVYSNTWKFLLEAVRDPVPTEF